MFRRLLGLMEAFKHKIRAPNRDQTSEAIVQVLKEMLQTMHSDEIFQRVQEKSGQNMWALTSTVIDAFCPDLRGEIMPGESSLPEPKSLF